MGRALPRGGPRHDGGSADLGDVSGLTTEAVAAEAVARSSYGKLVAFLAASAKDVAAAEDALSEAFSGGLFARIRRTSQPPHAPEEIPS